MALPYVLFKIDPTTGKEFYYAPDWDSDAKITDDPRNAMRFQSARHAYRFGYDDDNLDDWRAGRR